MKISSNSLQTRENDHDFVNDCFFSFLSFVSSTKQSAIQKSRSLDKELGKTIQTMREKDQNRLKIEGHVIRILQNINSIKPELITDPTTQITLSELKKQSKSLQNTLKSTVSNDKIRNNQMETESDNKIKYLRIIKDKDEEISRLKLEIEKLHRKDKVDDTFIEVSRTNITQPIEIVTNSYRERSFLNEKTAERIELQNEVMQLREKLRDYYAVKSDLEDIKQELEATRQQKKQLEDYTETLNNENIKLKKTSEAMKAQLSNGNAGFEALYDQLETLQLTIQTHKQQIELEKSKTKAAEDELDKTLHELALKNNRMNDLTIDYDANSMKSELLLEQITNLKNEVAMKEQEVHEISKQMISKTQKMEILIETERVRSQEMEILKSQIKKLNVRKQRRDERILEMQKVIDSSAVRIQEKDSIIERQSIKIKQQRETITQFADAANTIRNSKSKIKEFSNVIVDLKQKISDLENEAQRREEHLKELRDANNKMMDTTKERDEYERNYMQAKIDLDNIQQKIEILQSTLSTQAKQMVAAREEASQAKKSASELQKEIERLNFEGEKEKSKFENELKTLRLENDRLQQSSQILEETKTKLEQMLQKSRQEVENLNLKFDEKVTEINSGAAQRIQAIEKTHDLEKKQFEQRAITSEERLKESHQNIMQLNSEITKLKSSVDAFESQQATLQELVESDDIQTEIRKMQLSIKSSNNFTKKLNEIMKVGSSEHEAIIQKSSQLVEFNNKVQQNLKTENVFDEIQRLKTFEANVTNAVKSEQALNEIQCLQEKAAQLQEMKTKLSKFAKKHQHSNIEEIFTNYESQKEVLNQVKEISQLDKISQIPASISELKSIVDQVKQVTNVRDIDKLPDVVAQIQQSHDLLEQTQSVLSVKKLKEIPNVVNSLVSKQRNISSILDSNDIIESVETLKAEKEAREEEIAALTEKYEQTKEVIQKASDVLAVDSSQLIKQAASMNKLMNQIKVITNVDDLLQVPKAVASLANDQKQLKTIISAKYGDAANEKAVPKAVASIFDHHQATLNQLQKYVSFVDDSDLPAAVFHLKTENDTRGKIISQVQNLIPFQKEEQLPQKVSELKSKIESLAKKDEARNQMLMQLQNTLQFQEESQLPRAIERLIEQNSKLSQEADAAKEHHSNFIVELQKHVSFKNEKQFPQILEKLLENKNESTERLEELDKSHQKLMENIQKIVNFQDESQLPQEIAKLEETKQNYLKLMNEIQEILPFNSEAQIPQIIQSQIKKQESTNRKLEEAKTILNEVKQLVSCDSIKDAPVYLSKMIEERNKETEAHNKLIQDLHEVVSFNKEEDLIDGIQQIKENHQNLLSQINKHVAFKKESQIPKAIETMKRNHENFVKQLQTITKQEKREEEIIQYFTEKESIIKTCNSILENDDFENLPEHLNQCKSIFNELKECLEASENDEITGKVKNLLEQNSNITNYLNEASQFLNEILSHVSSTIKTFSFPLNKEVSQKLMAGFIDYTSCTEMMRKDFEQLMKQARSLGFGGTSCVEAADFLANELCKKKAQEQLEEMVTQLKQVREDREKERKVFEQRIAKNAEKLKEVRLSKQAMLEESAEKQTELYDQIDQLQKEIRDIETNLEQLTRVKEELIRLGSHEVYDKEALRSWLTREEISRLKL